MGLVKQWQLEKFGLGEALYQAFVRLIEDPEELRHTGAQLQWVWEGQQSSWREDDGIFVFERRWLQGGVTRVELWVDTYGEEDDEIAVAELLRMETVASSGLKHAYACESTEGYRIAREFLESLYEELCALAPTCVVCEKRKGRRQMDARR